LIKSTRGRHGGFTLNKKTEEISLNDIINAVGNEAKYNGCILGFEECSDERPCAIHREWFNIKKEIDQLFDQVTLSQIAAKENIYNF
jgi:Rrf2 family protein